MRDPRKNARKRLHREIAVYLRFMDEARRPITTRPADYHWLTRERAHAAHRRTYV